MKLAPLLLSSLISVSALSAVACGGSVVEPPATAGATKAPIAANGHGAVKLLGEALGEVALRPEQRTEIEKLATEAEARHRPLFDGRKDLMLAFADQVEKGTIDRTAIQAQLDKVTADMEKSRNDDRAALVRLHDILDKQQRNDFVDALEKNFKAKARHGFGEGEGARPGFGHMHKLAKDLNLTDDQKDKIKDVFKESWREGRKEHHEHGAKHEGRRAWGAHHKGGKHALEAFREDKLELDKVAPPHDLKAAANAGVDHMTKVAEKVVPILTPEQRKIAADKLREMANAGDTSLLVH